MMRLILLLVLILAPSLSHAGYQSLGHLEDDATANADVLVGLGCEREDTPTTDTSASLDWSHVKCNNVGRIFTSTTIDSAIPAGSNLIGSVNVNTFSPGTGATDLGKAQGGTALASDVGAMLLCVRHDTSTTGLGANGTYNPCSLNASGAIYTVDDTELPTAATLTDATTNPTVPAVASFLMCFNGTTWDRCKPALTDTDDNAISLGQSTGLMLNMNYVSDGTQWVRWQGNPIASATGQTPACTAGSGTGTTASTNATLCKAAAGAIYGLGAVNTSTTIAYLRLYNLTTSPTCSSSTGFVRSIPIPPAAASGQGGGIVHGINFGEPFSTGISFCVTGGGGNTDNTNSPAGVYIALHYH